MDPVNDAALDREIERALAVNPSPEFVARVRTRIAEEPSPASRGFGWLFAGVATVAAAAALVLAVRMASSTRPPATAPLLTSRSIGSAVVVPAVVPATQSLVSGVSRTAATRTPEPLFDVRETMALQRLIASVRDARVDLSPLLNDPMPAPMTLQPIDDLVIAPLVIEPLTQSGTEGERP